MAHPTSHLFSAENLWSHPPLKLGHETIEKARRGEGQVKAVEKQGWLQYMTGWWYNYPSEKCESVGIIPNIWKNKKGSKPPTRWSIVDILANMVVVHPPMER